eukprot:8450818-Lingulodinium_polyedra.AAC.1
MGAQGCGSRDLRRLRLAAARRNAAAGQHRLPGLWPCCSRLGPPGCAPVRWLGGGPTATRRCVAGRWRG